ncbi:MAG: GMC family oxidoreductase [Alphaproteobacteria bacterium]
MLLDARSLESGTSLDYDLCIIGAGAAGITIALELAAPDLRICVLESGGLDYDPDTQALAAGSASNEFYPDLETNRLRYLGGTTNHWGGGTQRFGVMDFERRSWVPNSGWPITRYDLEDYYDRAHPYLELPAPEYDLKAILARGRLKPLPFVGEWFDYAIGYSSTPTRFGEVYRSALTESTSIDAYLNANVVDIVAADDGLSIARLDCAVLDGPRFQVRARRYVLATGGIENARLMLVSRGVHANGLGNAHDVVGRYFMDHPVVSGGILYPSIPADDLRRYLVPTVAAPESTTTLELSEKAMRERQIGGLRIPLASVTRYFASEGIEAYHALLDSISTEYDEGRLWDDIGKVARDIDMIAEAISRQMFSKRLFDHANDRDFYLADCMLEQTPDPENRVMLNDDRDALDLQRVNLQWRVSDFDRRTMQEAIVLFGESVAATGIGRVRVLLEQERTWGSQLSFGHHHSGATRMGDDPKTSVVDHQHKVHGLSNLHVAGSSVFPTCSHVPVTLTVVATSIRLADHLKTALRS